MPEGVAALPRVPGYVFYSSDLALASGRYRLKLAFVRSSFVNALTNSASSGHAFPSGLVVEVLHDSNSIGFRPLALDELARGALSVEFEIPAIAANRQVKTELRLFSSGKTGLTIGNASIELAVKPDPAADIAAFNYVPMLAVGPAGVRGPGPNGRGRAIHSKPGVAGWIAHCGDDHAQHRRPKRVYDGLYNCLWYPPGRYEAQFEFDIHEAGAGSTIWMYIIAEQGHAILAKGCFEPHRRGVAASSLIFEIGERMPVREDGLLEFMVWSGGRVGFSLTALRICSAPHATATTAAHSGSMSGLFAELPTGAAGMRLPGAITSLTGITGFVFSDHAVDLSPGSYRLSLDVGRATFTQPLTNQSGLGFEVVQGTLLLSYREIPRAELERGEASIEFRVPATSAQDCPQVEFRLWSVGIAEVEFCGARVEPITVSLPPQEFAGFDALMLSSAGPAGEWSPAPASRRMAIHAKAGATGNVSSGPRVWLPAGSYEVTFELYVDRAVENAAVSVDVVSSLGANVLAEGIFAPNDRGLVKRMMGDRWRRLEGTLPFYVPVIVPDGDNGCLEFRTWSNGGFEFFLVSLRLKRLREMPNEARQLQNLLPGFQLGPAGQALHESIVAVPKTAGFVFSGAIGDPSPGHYCLNMVFDRGSFVSGSTDRSGYASRKGLVLELLRGSTSLGCRPITRDEFARGNISVEFEIPAGNAKGKVQTEARLYSAGDMGFAITSASVERISKHTPALDIANFNFVPLLSLGQAGTRGPGPKGLGRVIHAQRGVPGFIAFGPYVWFAEGRYQASFDFVIDPDERMVSVKTEVVTNLGERLLAEESIEVPWRQNRVMSLVGRRRRILTRQLRFEIPAEAPADENGFLEFRVWTPGTTAFSFVALRISRAS